MDWLERWVQAMTHRPGWVIAASHAWAALALQSDGFLWNAAVSPAMVAVATANAALGILALVVACFACHASWFRMRWRRDLQASMRAPIPERPWEKDERHRPVGPRYLASLAGSAAATGIVVPLLLAGTPLIELGLVVFGAAMAVALAAGLLRLWVRPAPRQPAPG